MTRGTVSAAAGSGAPLDIDVVLGAFGIDSARKEGLQKIVQDVLMEVTAVNQSILVQRLDHEAVRLPFYVSEVLGSTMFQSDIIRLFFSSRIEDGAANIGVIDSAWHAQYGRGNFDELMSSLSIEMLSAPWTLYVPTCYATHYSLFRVDHAARRIEIVENLGPNAAARRKRVGALLANYLIGRQRAAGLPAGEYTLVVVPNIPLQTDGVTCGPMICATAEFHKEKGVWPTSADFTSVDHVALRLLSLQRALEAFRVGVATADQMSGLWLWLFDSNAMASPSGSP